jgi:CRISPR-associated protein Csm4
MKNYIYKMKFSGGVRFGRISGGMEDSDYAAGSDTLFSALYIETYRIFGKNYCDKMLEYAAANKFLLTDLMPYTDDTYYIPKPLIQIKRDSSPEQTEGIKKRLKELKYIPVDKIESYFRLDNADDIKNFTGFTGAREDLRNRNRVKQGEDTDIYVVLSYSFLVNSGLYFIATMEDDIADILNQAIDSLGYTGIGGERSIGFGRYEIQKAAILSERDTKGSAVSSCEKALLDALYNTHKYYLSLSTIIPSDEDIDKLYNNSFYKLSKSSGFIYSQDYSNTQKKRKQITTIDAGAVFKNKIQGRVAELADSGAHAVYRFGKAFLIGVDADDRS